MATELKDRLAAETEGGDEGGDGDGDEESPSAEPDADEEAEDEEGSEPEAQTAPAPPSSETVMRALEKEHTRHANALRKIMGEGFEGYDDCPVCLSMGYVFGSPLADDDGVEVCSSCKGFGQRKTPSLVQGHETRQCFTCLGNGYVEKVTPAPSPGAEVVALPGAVPATAPDDPRVAELRGLGYTVLPPFVPPAGS